MRAAKTVLQVRQKRSRSRLLRHHLLLALGSVACFAVLYVTRPYRDWISRASFASAYPALLLLAATLCIGPWNVLRNRRNPISSDLRRDIGIWAGILGLTHAVVGQCVHLRGRPWLYYLYPQGSHHWSPLRHDLFGFSNFTGLASALILLALFATSNDVSLRRLGTPGWKGLQKWNYLCFGLAAAHTVLYQVSEKRWSAFVFASGAGVVLTIFLQLAGLRHRRNAVVTSSWVSV